MSLVECDTFMNESGEMLWVGRTVSNIVILRNLIDF